MKHRVLDFMVDPHVPENDAFSVQMALNQVCQEIEEDLQYSEHRPDSERLDRLEAGLLLLSARLRQTGIV